MGTTWSLRFDNPRMLPLAEVRAAVESALGRVVTQMSNWEPDSDISRFNRAPAGSRHVLPAEFAEVMRCADRWATASGGAIDPTIGPLAACWGLAQDPGVDATRVNLAGWSHGAWSIMDLMTMALDRPGEAALADPTPDPLGGIRSLFLVYPYGGPGALSRSRPWVRQLETYGVVAEKDHLTGQADALRVFDAARQIGSQTHLWIAPGTHAFDAPGHEGFPSPMRYDPELAEGCLDRYLGFLNRTLDIPAPPFSMSRGGEETMEA